MAIPASVDGSTELLLQAVTMERKEQTLPEFSQLL